MIHSIKIRQMIQYRGMPGASISKETLGVPQDAIAACIRKTELFCNISEDLLHVMLEAMEARRVKPEAQLLREGSRADWMVVLASGRAVVSQSRGGQEEINTLAELDEPWVLGAEALLGIEIRRLSVIMETEGTVLCLRRGDFARIIAKESVTWLTLDEMQNPPDSSRWLWIGESAERPKDAKGISSIRLDRLRDVAADPHPAANYCCCAKDDQHSALAAFFLSQRDISAVAVREGKRIGTVISPEGRTA